MSSNLIEEIDESQLETQLIDDETQLDTQLVEDEAQLDTQLVEDETQLDTQEIEAEYEENTNEGGQDIEHVEKTKAVIPPAQAEKKERKGAVELVREPGKSLFPFARVQKIIRADKEIPIIAKEATFLISLATEEFIKRLCEAGHHVAQKERRSTVQHRDIATVVRRVDEFLFLEEIIAWTSSDPPAKRPKPKAPTTLKSSGPTLLDQFVGQNKRNDLEGPEIVMNEDGTMYAGVEEE